MKKIDVLGYELGVPTEESEGTISIRKKDFLVVEVTWKNKNGSLQQIPINVQAECGCTSDEFIDEFNKLK